MKTCLRCLGWGARAPILDHHLEKTCWVCQGQGTLPSPDKWLVHAHTFNRTRPHNLRTTKPEPTHKEAISMLNKPGPWSRTPRTMPEARIAWCGAPFGRRCIYVWVKLRQHQSFRLQVSEQSEESFRRQRYIYANSAIDIYGMKYDPHKEELEKMIEEWK